MANKWRQLPLNQLYDFRSGLSKPRSEFGFGFGFLSFKDVFYNFFVPERLTELVNSTKKERESCSIKRGDVFLTRTSETMEDLGMSCVALKDYESATFNGFTKRLRPKAGTNIVPEYAAYYFRSPKFRLDVTAMSSLSTRASLNNEMLGRLKIVLPSFAEQSAIGFILKGFDDKIELNRRMNQTLEAIARAIFKSWFVDFDPVRAKTQGRDTGLPDDIAALFPDGFEGSEVGEIPMGWSILTFKELAEAKQGKYIPKNKMNDLPSSEFAYPVWGGNGIRGYTATYMYKEPVVVLTCRGSNCGLIDITESPTWISNIAFACRPKYGSVNFINIYLSYSSLTDTITGSAQPQITYTSLKNKRMQFPVHQEVCDAYSDYIDSMYKMIRGNNRQSTTLASLRDTLLPKLISGELRVPDAETFIKEAPL